MSEVVLNLKLNSRKYFNSRLTAILPCEPFNLVKKMVDDAQDAEVTKYDGKVESSQAWRGVLP